MDNNDYALETRLTGSLIQPYAAITLIPITRENIHELKPGDWIWDDKIVERRAHKWSIYEDKTSEPKGFRQIHLLSLKDFDRGFSRKPFMLSDVDSNTSGYTWERFEENRFYICG